jgi:hypothetical protein
VCTLADAVTPTWTIRFSPNEVVGPSFRLNSSLGFEPEASCFHPMHQRGWLLSNPPTSSDIYHR